MIEVPSGLFPDAVRVVITDGRDVTDETSELYPEEVVAIRAAIPSRQHEFAAGRRCARQALARIGVAPVAIPIGRLRAPIWPDGVVGSITHCRGFIGAAVARSRALRAIGWDVELALPLDKELFPLICTSAEIAWIAQAGRPAVGDWAKVIFSAKESVHKCVFPLYGKMLDFLDVVVHLTPETQTFVVDSANPEATAGIELGSLSGRFAIDQEFVITSAVLAS